MFKNILLIFTTLLLFFSFSEATYAAKIQRCKEVKPVTAPTIINAIPGNSSVKLIWTEGEDPITHYLLEYGLSKDSMIYGAQNIGPKGTTTYTVDHLTNGKRYYFRVNAVNICRLKASHTVSAVPGVGSTAYIGSTLPRLSFYKAPSGTSASDLKHETKGAAVPVATKDTVVKCANGCYGLQLLTIEIIALLLLFFFAYRYTTIKPLYALSIPIILALIFYMLNNKCTSDSFFCQYFYILNIAIFILIISLQRQRLMHKLLGETKI